jgi:hypothetical protein
MDEIQYNTPCVIKLGSFAGKVGFKNKEFPLNLFVLFR